MPQNDIIEDGGKRVTVIFNAKDMKVIQREVARREKEVGYSVSVSDILRDLVRGRWTPAK